MLWGRPSPSTPASPSPSPYLSLSPSLSLSLALVDMMHEGMYLGNFVLYLQIVIALLPRHGLADYTGLCNILSA